MVPHSAAMVGKERHDKNLTNNNSILMDSSTVTCWTSPFVILGVVGLFCPLIHFLWKILLANNVDPDQMPLYVASDLSLHCLPKTFLQVPDKDGLNSAQFFSIYSNHQTIHRELCS